LELLKVRDFEQAIKELELALEGQPDMADGLLYADLLEGQGQYSAARRALRKAIKYPTTDTTLAYEVGYRLALLDLSNFDSRSQARSQIEILPPLDSRRYDLKAMLLFAEKRYKEALVEAQRGLSLAQNNEARGWLYFHLAQIYYELRNERETFGSLFNAVNNGRGHALVKRITDYWEDRRHEPFPVD
jgi:tetratricopeptide (TPR) repeat protein